MNKDPKVRTWSDEDDVFMLMLCVRPERLEDPTRWCEEVRKMESLADSIITVEDADDVWRMAERLGAEAGWR